MKEHGILSDGPQASMRGGSHGEAADVLLLTYPGILEWS